MPASYSTHGELAESFNSMTADLKHVSDKLKESMGELESSKLWFENIFNSLVSRGFQGKVYSRQILIWNEVDTFIFATGLSIILIILLLI